MEGLRVKIRNEVGKLRNLRHTLTDTEKALSLGILNGVFNKNNVVGKYEEHGFAQYQYDIYSGEEATKFLLILLSSIMTGRSISLLERIISVKSMYVLYLINFLLKARLGKNQQQL